MSKARKFKASIEDAGGGGMFVTVPFDVEKEFGKKRVKVRASIDGEPYRGSLVRMGGECHMLIIVKEIRTKIGKGPGEKVAVTVEEDLEPRVVDLPADLAARLESEPEAAGFFRRLSYTHQREYVTWIDSARREATRVTRLEKMIGMLREGTKSR